VTQPLQPELLLQQPELQNGMNMMFLNGQFERRVPQQLNSAPLPHHPGRSRPHNWRYQNSRWQWRIVT
jgi:hypothetical protein